MFDGLTKPKATRYNTPSLLSVTSRPPWLRTQPQRRAQTSDVQARFDAQSAPVALSPSSSQILFIQPPLQASSSQLGILLKLGVHSQLAAAKAYSSGWYEA